MSEILLGAVAIVVLLALIWIGLRVSGHKNLPGAIAQLMEDKHRAMLKDLHEGLTRQGDRLDEKLTQTSDRLRATVDERLQQISGKVSERRD
ncbi:MAG: hypothetical protein ACREUV_00450 [Burkholderiales bacterium]